MSAEARMQEQIVAAVRGVTAPLERAVEELSARLAAVEGDGGAKDAAPSKRASSGRTAKAKAASEAPSVRAEAQPAEVTAVTGDGVKTERVPQQREGKDA